MDREKMGALTDGIYAIAMTILALELPLPNTTQELAKSFQDIAFIVIDYGLTFILLFAFWYNQRRINDLLEIHKRVTLFLNAVILMLVCLVPFSATLLYQIGQTTTLFEANYATLVDLIFVFNCLVIDLCIHGILALVRIQHSEAGTQTELILKLTHSRRVATFVIILAMMVSLMIPIPNRMTLVFIPLLLIFEDEIVLFFSKISLVKKNESQESKEIRGSEDL